MVSLGNLRPRYQLKDEKKDGIAFAKSHWQRWRGFSQQKGSELKVSQRDLEFKQAKHHQGSWRPCGRAEKVAYHSGEAPDRAP